MGAAETRRSIAQQILEVLHNVLGWGRWRRYGVACAQRRCLTNPKQLHVSKRAETHACWPGNRRKPPAPASAQNSQMIRPPQRARKASRLSQPRPKRRNCHHRGCRARPAANVGPEPFGAAGLGPRKGISARAAAAATRETRALSVKPALAYAAV